MKVGIDIDGVLFPWEDVAREALHDQFQVSLEPSKHWYAIKESVTPKQWRWLWSAEGQNQVFCQTSRCYPGAVAAVNSILETNEHEVHFVTHRDPRETVVATAMFLRRHFGGYRWAGVHMIKSSTPKRGLVSWDVFVDDKPDTIRDFISNTDAQLFAPRRPWNEQELDMEINGMHVYDDPMDIVRWLLGSS